MVRRDYESYKKKIKFFYEDGSPVEEDESGNILLTFKGRKARVTVGETLTIPFFVRNGARYAFEVTKFEVDDPDAEIAVGARDLEPDIMTKCLLIFSPKADREHILKAKIDLFGRWLITD